MALSITRLSGSAYQEQEKLTRNVNGFADAAFQISTNLIGSPALSLKEISSYQQDWILGVSLKVTAPTGQYDNERLVNIGTNRWSFKPEIGISKALGRWTLEAASAAVVSRRAPVMISIYTVWLGSIAGELGKSPLANNLNPFAKAANTVSLQVTPDTEKALQDACGAV